MIAATAPANLLGTAFGPYNLLCGNLLLVTSVVAGLLGGWFGPFHYVLDKGRNCHDDAYESKLLSVGNRNRC